MEERLKALLDRVSDWLKYEEAKNVALVTLNSVGVGANGAFERTMADRPSSRRGADLIS